MTVYINNIEIPVETLRIEYTDEHSGLEIRWKFTDQGAMADLSEGGMLIKEIYTDDLESVFSQYREEEVVSDYSRSYGPRR